MISPSFWVIGITIGDTCGTFVRWMSEHMPRLKTCIRTNVGTLVRRMPECLSEHFPEHVPAFTFWCQKNTITLREHTCHAAFVKTMSIHAPCLLPNHLAEWGSLEVSNFVSPFACIVQYTVRVYSSCSTYACQIGCLPFSSLRSSFPITCTLEAWLASEVLEAQKTSDS